MRISDWSSDVCSSDLPGIAHQLVTRIRDERRSSVGEQRHRFACHALDQLGAQFLAAVIMIGDHRPLRTGMPQQFRADPAVLHRNDISIARSEEHTSELQSLMRRSYAVFCLKKNQQQTIT